MPTLRKLLRDSAAVTSIEYGIIAALLALGIISSVNTVGARVGDIFADLASPPVGAPPGNSGNGP